MFRFVLLFFLDRSIFSSCTEDPIVTTPLGTIQGTVNVSRSGMNFYTFTGIPYAEAPIGKLRFKPPVPRKPWSGVLNATQTGPACYPSDLNDTDCLHLTVYTRKINDEKDLRPVLVLMGVGDFEYGSPMILGPDYLMDHNVVLVIFNYRYSIFGFFSTGDNHAPGNYGLKDQVETLKWVKNNIKHFGGDPNKVTICGAEAGAAEVGLHLISAMSRGLFYGAMLISGSPLNFWAIDKDPVKLAKKEAGIYGCPTESSEKMVECMAKIPADEKLWNSHYDIFEWNGAGRSHSPVVEVENGGQERFLEKDPILSILAGDVADVPIFIGTTRYEEVSSAKAILRQQDLLDDLSQNWTRILPIIFEYDPNDAISNKLREFYFGSIDTPINDNSADSLISLFGDARIRFGVIEFTKLISQKITKPVYLYQYNYLGKGIQPFIRPDEFQQKIANVHQMYYIFHNKIFETNFTSDTPDGRFVTKMTTLWKNFMETGNPTPKAAAELDNVIWEPFKKENPKYLDINETLKMENGIYFPERMEFWEKLFPLLEKN